MICSLFFYVKRSLCGDCGKKFQKLLEEHTDKKIESNRIKKIISKYSSQYKIDKEITMINGKKVHVDYLPTINEMLEAKNKYGFSKETIAAALFKIEKDNCFFFTDSRDLNLQGVYEANKKQADNLANKLLEINTKEFNYQFTSSLAMVFSGFFATVFNQTYGDWRESLEKSNQKELFY